jgi:hypothetical protein
MFPTVEDGHVQMRLKRFNINPFGIGGRYAGMITRISDRAVINVSAGGGLLPSVVGRHKRRLLAEEDADLAGSGSAAEGEDEGVGAEGGEEVHRGAPA